MSLSLIRQPAEFVLGANPAEYWFETNNLYAAQGSQAKFRLTLTAIPLPGKQLIFSWRDVYIVLTTTHTPDQSGYQIGVPSLLTALEDWVNDDFVPALQSNYYLQRDFDIAMLNVPGGASVVIELTAKAKGTAYNIGFSSNVGVSLSGLQFLGGSDQVQRPNFQTHVELYIAKATLAEYDRIVASQSHSSESSRFRLESILASDYYGSALPDYGGLSVKNISSAIVKFYAKYAEAYGNPIAIQKLTQTALRYALQGGWGKDHHAQNSFMGRLNLGQNLLSEANEYRIGKFQQHFLNYLHWQPFGHFSVYVRITYTDETSEEKEFYTQTSGATKPSLWCIPAGYPAIATVKDPAKDVYSYEVWVGASSNSTFPYSQRVKQVVDVRPVLEQTLLLYKNSFGVYEVFRCTGTVTESSTVEKETARRALAANYAVTDAATVTYGQLAERAWEVNTGFKSKAEMQVFAALLLSPSVFRVGSNFAPVSLRASEAVLSASRSGRLNEATFTVVSDAPQTHGSHV